MLDLSHYTPGHRAELEGLLRSPAWQQVLESGLVEEVKAEKIAPGQTLNFIDTATEQLLELNGKRVGEAIARGEGDRGILLRELGKWPVDLEGKNPRISFLGLNVTAKCNFDPRCIYCNQPWVEAAVGLEGWKRLVEEVTANNNKVGPYIYLTGGEPLTLGEEIWGDEGLVRFATERGAAVNVNTNALAMTPEVVLRFIKVGLARLHISLDTADPQMQDYLFGGKYSAQVLEGIYNVQLARELAGVSYPEIHTNCVLTNKNLELFAGLVGFILEKRKQVTERNDPLSNDLLPHVIPVGGSSNDALRPTAGEFSRFYERIWPQVCRLWDEYQENLGMSKDKRRALFGYFSNPFLRVEHQGGLAAYAKTSAAGRYGSLALAQHCYVAPTQASITPDGYQFRCGSHAIRRLLPIGNIREKGVLDNIRTGLPDLGTLPQEEYCHGCALATLYINQSVEAKLKERIEGMIPSPGGQR